MEGTSQGAAGAEAIEDDDLNLEDDLVVRVLDMLNFKVVPKQPGDRGYFEEDMSRYPSQDQYYHYEFCRLHEEKEEQKKEKEKVSASLQHTSEELKKEKAANDKLVKELEQLRKAHESLVKENGTLKEKEAIGVAKSLEETELKQAKDKLNQLERQCAEQREQLTQNEDQIQKLKMDKEQAVSLVEDCKQDVKRYEQAVEKLRKELATVRENEAKLTNELKATREMIDQLRTQNLDVQSQTTKVTRDLDEARDAIMKLKEALKLETEAKVKAQADLQLNTENNISSQQVVQESQATAHKAETQRLEGIISQLEKRLEDEGNANKLQKTRLENLQKILKETEDSLKMTKAEKDKIAKYSRGLDAKHKKLRESTTFTVMNLQDLIDAAQSVANNDNSTAETSQRKIETMAAHVKDKFARLESSREDLKTHLRKQYNMQLSIIKMMDQLKKSPVVPVEVTPEPPSASFAWLRELSMDTPVMNPPPPPPVIKAGLLSYRDMLVKNIPASVEPSSEEHAVDTSKRCRFHCLCYHGQNQVTPHQSKLHLKCVRKFKCKHCTQRFCLLVHLNSHLRQSHKLQHSVNERYSCRLCGKKCVSRVRLQQHKKNMHTVKKSKRLLQGKCSALAKITLKKRSTRRGSYWNIVNPNNDERVAKRQGAMVRENSVSSDLPEETREGNTTIQSTSSAEPPQVVDPPAQRTEHGVDESVANSFMCLCGYNASNRSRLTDHIRYYNDERKFACHLCGMHFRRNKQKCQHLQRKHNIKTAHISHLECRYCAKRFRTRKNLIKHQRAMQHSGSGVANQPASQVEKEAQSQPLIVEQADDEPEPSNISTISGVAESDHLFSEIWKTIEPPTIDKNHGRKNKPKSSKQKQGFKKMKAKAGSSSTDSVRKSGLHHVLEQSNATAVQEPAPEHERKFECNVCHRRFIMHGQLQKHLKHTHKAENLRTKGHYGCTLCGKLLPSLNLLVQHRRVIHGNAPSPNIQRKRQQSKKLNQSKSPGISVPGTPTPSERIRFRCLVCPRDFGSTAEVRKHMKEDHDEDYELAGCPTCGGIFNDAAELRKHQDLKHKKKITKKPEGADLSRDTLGSRDPEQSTVAMPPPPPPLVPNSVGSNPGLKVAGKRRVPQLRPLQQNFFVTKKKHQVDRSKRHGFYCRCGSHHSNSRALTAHIQYFTQERKFACQLCSQRYLYLSALKAHMVRSHKNHSLQEQEIYGCSVCGSCFATLNDVFQHRRDVHNVPSEPLQVPPVTTTTEPNEAAGEPSVDLVTVPSPSTQTRHIKPKSTQKSSSVLKEQQHSIEMEKDLEHPICKCGQTFPDMPSIMNHIFSTNVTRAPNPSDLQQHGIDMKKDLGHPICLCGQAFPDLKSIMSHIFLSKAPPRAESREAIGSEVDKPMDVPASVSTAKEVREHSTPMKMIHKPIRMINDAGTHVCFCGEQFQEHEHLHRHIENANAGQSSSELHPPDVTLQPVSPATPAIPTKFAKENKIQNQKIASEPKSVLASEKLQRAPIISSVPMTAVVGETPSHAFNRLRGGMKQIFCKCGLEFGNRDSLNAHIQYFVLNKKVRCTICDKLFNDLSGRNKHIRRVHQALPDANYIGCNSCGVIFANRKEYRKHMVITHTETSKIDSCFCPIKFLTKRKKNAVANESATSLTQKITSVANAVNWVPLTSSVSVRVNYPNAETGGEPNARKEIVNQNQITVQPEPSSSSSSASESVKHGMDSSRSELGLYCLCGAVFRSAQTLRRHIRSFTEQMKFGCRLCSRRFLFASILRRHMVGVHKIVEKNGFGCKDCGEFFPSNMELYSHHRVFHNYGVPFEAELKYNPSTSTLGSQSQSQLSQQLSQEVPIDIDMGNEQRSSNEAEVHEELPVDPLADKQEYKCTCGKVFNSVRSRRTHVRAKTVGKIFVCSWCRPKGIVRFDSHGNLKKHVKSVHPNVIHKLQKYACGICAKTFAKHEDVVRHRTQEHGKGKQATEGQ